MVVMLIKLENLLASQAEDVEAEKEEAVEEEVLDTEEEEIEEESSTENSRDKLRSERASIICLNFWTVGLREIWSRNGDEVKCRKVVLRRGRME
jgi:hypothetical protein